MTPSRTTHKLLFVWASSAALLLGGRTLTAADQAANPSFSGTVDQDTLNHTFAGTFRQGLPGATFNFSVFNFPATIGTTSPMSLDTLHDIHSLGNASAIALQAGTVSGLLPVGTGGTPNAPMQLILSTNQPGNPVSVSYTLKFTSDDPSAPDPIFQLAIFAYATVLARADYNSDGFVNSLDYAYWRSHFGTNNQDADGNQNGVVDAGDYVIWRKFYTGPGSGSSSAGGAALSGTFAVPEPASSILGLLGVGAAGLYVRTRSRHLRQLS